MTVSNLNNPLRPAQGLIGPPNLMIGRVSQLGDASGGLVEVGFDLEEGFFWMPLTITISQGSTLATDIAWSLDFLDSQVPGYSFGHNELLAAHNSENHVRNYNLPRVIFRSGLTSGVPPRILGNAFNIGVGISIDVRVAMIRWPLNAFPSNFLAFFSAPP